MAVIDAEQPPASAPAAGRRGSAYILIMLLAAYTLNFIDRSSVATIGRADQDRPAPD